MVVENHQVVSDGLVALVSDQPDMVMIGTADTVAEAIAQARELAPDIVLLDFRLPDGTGAEAGMRIRELLSETRLIFLSRDDSEAAQVAAIEAGASALLHQSGAADAGTRKHRPPSHGHN